jgi:homoaconitate hydratase
MYQGINSFNRSPNSVKKSTPLYQLEKEHIKIHKAYLLSCTNARASDLKEAAAILKFGKVAPGVEFYVAAASSEVQNDAEVSGDWKILIDAGARPLPAGCGPCIGLGVGLLKEGEVGISATNRNYKGRMGSPLAEAYLASPAVVAASALTGFIQRPPSIDGGFEGAPVGTYTISPPRPLIDQSNFNSTSVVHIVPGFPSILNGEIIFCDSNNLNTDGIYP